MLSIHLRFKLTIRFCIYFALINDFAVIEYFALNMYNHVNLSILKKYFFIDIIILVCLRLFFIFFVHAA